MQTVANFLAMYKRVAIAGGPKTGKTELAKRHQRGRDLYHTDAVIGTVSWEDTPPHFIAMLKDEDDFLVEGVQVARILRKAHRLGLACPVDAVVRLARPKIELTKGQMSMAKGEQKIWGEWLEEDGQIPILLMD